jgi:DNA-binding NtrC family response regulator
MMFVADDVDIFTVLGEVLDCGDYAVIYSIERNACDALLQNGWADVAVVDLRGISLERVEQLLAHLWQFPFSRTVPVLICSDGIYCSTACESLCRPAQQLGTTLLEPPAPSGRLLDAIQQRLHRLPV